MSRHNKRDEAVIFTNLVNKYIMLVNCYVSYIVGVIDIIYCAQNSISF